MLPHEISVLIVDDSLAARRLHQKTLEPMGFKLIDGAEDGESALKLMQEALGKKRIYDIVICDMSMPNMCGVEFMKSCQEIKEFATVKFVVITASSDQSDIIKAIGAGAADYLVKPVSPEQLITVMTRVAKALPKKAV